MIIYDLKCKQNHKFEGWFNDRAAFEDQKEKRLVICPICGSSDIEMLPSSITTISKEGSREARRVKSKEITPMMALKMFHEYIDKEFDDVGDRFAEVALKINSGLEEKRNIRGTTTKEDEETLKEEGVQFIKVPIPKFDS